MFVSRLENKILPYLDFFCYSYIYFAVLFGKFYGTAFILSYFYELFSAYLFFHIKSSWELSAHPHCKNL